MPLSVDGIAFDVGNTLIPDPFDLVLKRKSFEMKRAFSRLGHDFSEREITDAWSGANMKINYPHIDHFYQEPAIVKHCLDLLKVDGAGKAQLAIELLIIYRSGIQSAIASDKRIDHIRNVLSELRDAGKRLVAFGNGRQKPVELYLSWAGLREYFKTVSSSEKIGFEKPDIKVFNYMLHALGTVPARGMYVGDDPVNDILGAKKAGMLAVQYVPPVQVSTPWRDYKMKIRRRPDAVIREFGELLEIVK
jgi:HAD superfamily hydrolase (TIGR01549 family)